MQQSLQIAWQNRKKVTFPTMKTEIIDNAMQKTPFLIIIAES